MLSPPLPPLLPALLLWLGGNTVEVRAEGPGLEVCPWAPFPQEKSACSQEVNAVHPTLWMENPPVFGERERMGEVAPPPGGEIRAVG